MMSFVKFNPCLQENFNKRNKMLIIIEVKYITTGVKGDRDFRISNLVKDPDGTDI